LLPKPADSTHPSGREYDGAMSDEPHHDPRMRGFRSRSSVESVQQRIDDRVAALGSEFVPLLDAHNRILAEHIVATGSVPHFDRAAMDGYALRGEETFGSDTYTPASFRLIGRSRPGEPFLGDVTPGEAVAIATGAPMPRGADAVAKVESCRISDAMILVIESTPPRRHVGLAGEDIAVGETLFEPGRLLRPQDLGVLSALGAARVAVVRRPRVAILITGNEILPAAAAPDGCKIADMNGPMLAALIVRDGGTPELVGPICDDRPALRAAIASACRDFDAVLVTGGSSTGPEDHAPTLVAELGELSIHGVALRPASPSGLGFIGGVPVLLAPGNPLSCLCAYDLFGGRIVRRRGGRPPDWPYRAIAAPLAEKLVSTLGRVDYARVRIVNGRVIPLSTSGASILSSATRADGFVLVPAAKEGFPMGAIVTVHLYDSP
jgi:molybdopterin molybdotransferase